LLAGAVGVRAVFVVSGAALLGCAVCLAHLVRGHRGELSGDAVASAEAQPEMPAAVS
jgi:hypothetical protein